MRKYILDDDGEPVLEPDVLRWAQWFESNDDKRQVARNDLPRDVTVSTVFLGIDHYFGTNPNVPPVLWELMIFTPEGHPLDDHQERFTSREEALGRHREIVRRLTADLPID